MSALREWTNLKRQVVAWLVGAAVGTIAWFALSPSLSHQQEEVIGWLLLGSYLVALVVTLLMQRAGRNAEQARSS